MFLLAQAGLLNIKSATRYKLPTREFFIGRMKGRYETLQLTDKTSRRNSSERNGQNWDVYLWSDGI